MDENLGQAAVQAVSNVFETMFFVFLEADQPETNEGRFDRTEPGEEGLQCTIGFQGPIQGTLRLWIPYALARELATNFLGLDTEASEYQAVDMVKELTNMVCGNLFSIFDRQGVYVLDMPRAELVPRKPGQEAEAPGTLKLDFWAEERRIRLEIESGPPAAGPAE